MKQFIVNNIEAIFVVINMIIFIAMSQAFNIVEGTKYEILHKYYFIIFMVVGVMVSGAAIGKWIIK